MKELFYFIEVSLAVSLFYGLYYILFRQMTFFLGNRIYLLSSLIVAFAIPFLNFPVATDIHQVAVDYVVDDYDSGSATFLSAHETKPEIGIGINDVLVVVYWLGVLVFVTRCIYAMIRVLQLKRCSVPTLNDNGRIFRADIQQPFCFFNCIFLPRHEVSQVILQHEKAHVQKFHWMDLLLMEFSCALLWFNPIMIFFRKSLKLQHEYEADACALGKGLLLEDYLDAIFVHLKGTYIAGPISQFNSTHIKNRVIMMTQEKTNWRHSFRYLFSLPLICILLFAFSSPPLDSATSVNKDSDIVVVIDPGHGANDAGASSKDGVFEKEVVLSIAKQIQKILDERKIGVVLTRSGDDAVSLSQRISVAQHNKADLFISLHIGYDEGNPSASGINCIVSGDNLKTFKESKRLAEHVIRDVGNVTGIAVKGIKTFDAYVLRNNTVPAVIVDLGFLSNAGDRAFLKDPTNLTRLSQGIADAIVHHTK